MTICRYCGQPPGPGGDSCLRCGRPLPEDTAPLPLLDLASGPPPTPERPGWYPDPAGEGRWYWTGFSWEPPVATRRGRGLVVGAAAAAVATVLAVGLVAIGSGWLRPAVPSGSSQPTLAGPTLQPPSPAPASPAPASPAAAAARQVGAFGSLVAASVQVRAVVGPLVQQVEACQVNPTSAARQLTVSASRRAQLIAAAGRLPLAALPSGSTLRRSFVAALVSSARADASFAAWAANVARAGCPGHAPAGAAFRAGLAASVQATADKQRFVSVWNPLAGQYGLPPRSPNQL